MNCWREIEGTTAGEESASRLGKLQVPSVLLDRGKSARKSKWGQTDPPINQPTNLQLYTHEKKGVKRSDNLERATEWLVRRVALQTGDVGDWVRQERFRKRERE